MQEQRLTTRLITYWENIKGHDPLPIYAKINPGALDDLWKNCLVLKTEPAASAENLTYVYIHCGQEIAKAIGHNLSGRRMTTNMKFFPGANIIKRIDEVANLKEYKPLLDDGQFVNDKNQVVKYRACLLAFGTQDIVSHILVGVTWRTF